MLLIYVYLYTLDGYFVYSQSGSISKMYCFPSPLSAHYNFELLSEIVISILNFKFHFYFLIGIYPSCNVHFENAAKRMMSRASHPFIAHIIMINWAHFLVIMFLSYKLLYFSAKIFHALTA